MLAGMEKTTFSYICCFVQCLNNISFYKKLPESNSNQKTFISFYLPNMYVTDKPWCFFSNFQIGLHKGGFKEVVCLCAWLDNWSLDSFSSAEWIFRYRKNVMYHGVLCWIESMNGLIKKRVAQYFKIASLPSRCITLSTNLPHPQSKELWQLPSLVL